MGVGSRFRVSLALLFVAIIVSAVDEDVDHDSSENCSVDLGTFLPFQYSNLSNVVCRPIWNSYILRKCSINPFVYTKALFASSCDERDHHLMRDYSQTNDHKVTIILSGIYTTGWVGMGFSKDGMMYNASVIVGWITERSIARIKQYHVEGATPSEVVPDKGDLPLTVPPFVALHGATIYLAFQLKFANPLKIQPILLAVGNRSPEHHRLTPHDDKTTMRVDFSAGNLGIADAAIPPDTSSRTKKTHGMLGLFGWGLVMPYGAIIARYLKHRDPLWYYLHVLIQSVGFLLAFASVLVGVSLYERLQADDPIHRGLGIFVIVLSILQVLAVFLRPNEDSKIRKHWNWYHHWFGRIALFFGAVNIALGIQCGDAGIEWKIGYGFILGTVLLSCIVLEALSMLKRSEISDTPPAFQVNKF